MQEKVTQTDMVFMYLTDFGSITPLQALDDLGIMRLASRISDLKNRGYNISKTMISKKNRYGRTVRYAEYRLAGESECRTGL